MKSFIVLLALSLTATVHAVQTELPLPSCEAWYTARPGAAVERKGMALSSVTDYEAVFRTRFKGHDFQMTWDKELATYNMSIAKAGQELAYSMARIPTEGNPQSFAQVTVPGGPSLRLDCEIQEFRW